MREILFRGKRTEGPKAGQWVYGDLSLKPSTAIFHGETNQRGCNVVPETVGQFTGMTDKNGKKIFEGDVVQFSDKYPVPKSLAVSWSNLRGGWGLDSCNTAGVLALAAVYPLIEVIGNIHDNPDLLSREA